MTLARKFILFNGFFLLLFYSSSHSLNFINAITITVNSFTTTSEMKINKIKRVVRVIKMKKRLLFQHVCHFICFLGDFHLNGFFFFNSSKMSSKLLFFFSFQYHDTSNLHVFSFFFFLNIFLLTHEKRFTYTSSTRTFWTHAHTHTTPCTYSAAVCLCTYIDQFFFFFIILSFALFLLLSLSLYLSPAVSPLLCTFRSIRWGTIMYL